MDNIQETNPTEVVENYIEQIKDYPIAQKIGPACMNALGFAGQTIDFLSFVGEDLIPSFNAFMINWLLKGISKGKNLEKNIDRLYKYICFSKDNAIEIVKLFKKATTAESPKVCVLYGLIIANHLEKNSKFTQNELIVCKALENATDHDLSNFYKTMNDYIVVDKDKRKIKFPKDNINLSDFNNTCDWAAYNRIFICKSLEHRVESEILYMDSDVYYVLEPADVLMGYINEAARLWGDEQ